MVPHLLSMQNLENVCQGLCFFFRFVVVHAVPVSSFLHVSCGIRVFVCFPLSDSVSFHISPLEFMFQFSLFLFSLVCGSCAAEPLGTMTGRSVHTKTLANHPQVWHETKHKMFQRWCNKMINPRHKQYETTQYKHDTPSLWLIASQT